MTAPNPLLPVGVRPKAGVYLADTLRRRTFLREFVAARVTAEHAGSWLGPVWLLLTPVLSAILYFVVFGMLLGVDKKVENYPLFLLTGVLLYASISKTLTGASRSIRKNRDFVRTIPFPRILMPLTVAGVQARHLVWSILVLAVVAFMTSGFHVHWLATAGAIVLLSVLTAGLGLIVARIGAAIPDTSGLIPFIVRAGAYLSAVYFPLSVMTQNAPVLGQFLSWNPIAVGLDIARQGLSGQWAASSSWVLLGSAAVTSAIVGYLVFWRGEPGYGHV